MQLKIIYKCKILVHNYLQWRITFPLCADKVIFKLVSAWQKTPNFELFVCKLVAFLKKKMQQISHFRNIAAIYAQILKNLEKSIVSEHT
ncbi:MAG: hypothetical protein K940chlam7_01967 [Chlamydiae bacterium]|nr:hypothetical protein [Chlamydiota bacterium]